MLVEDSKKLEQVLLGLGIILLLVAFGFGWAGLEPHGANYTFPSSDAALGFAIAAGLCFVSVAIIHTRRQS